MAGRQNGRVGAALRRCRWAAALLLVGLPGGALAEPRTDLPPPPRSSLAPVRPSDPVLPPQQRVPLQQYRSDLEGQRFRLERYGNPNDLSQQRELQGLRQELGRTDRMLSR